MATDDPTDLRSHEEAARDLALKDRLRREQEVEDLKWLLGHPQGRRIATRILDRAGVNRTSYSHSGSQMAFLEGARDLGLWFTAEMLESSEEGYFKMLREFVANGR